jgi:tetratricopeptide (TPR) repeat protein
MPAEVGLGTLVMSQTLSVIFPSMGSGFVLICSTGVSESDTSMEQLVRQSNEFVEQGYFGPEALEVNDRLTQLVPENRRFWSRFGTCLKSADRLKDAKAAYEKARSLDPRHTVARAEIKKLDRWISARSEVLGVFEEGGPKGLRASINAAKKTPGKNQFRLEGRRLLAKQPGASEFDRIGLAAELGKAREYERALGIFREAAMSDDPNARAAATTGAAKVLRMMDKPKQAEKLCRQVLVANPTGKNAYYALNCLGAILSDQGRKEEADEAFRAAISIGRRFGIETSD